MNKRELYRNPSQGKLSGVCAGIADYFNIEVWLIRILVISAALLGAGFLVLLAYIALTLMLEKAPQNDGTMRSQHQQHTLKNKPWKQGKNAKQLLGTLDEDFANMEQRIQRMEAYVTSKAYATQRAFKHL